MPTARSGPPGGGGGGGPGGFLAGISGFDSSKLRNKKASAAAQPIAAAPAGGGGSGLLAGIAGFNKTKLRNKEQSLKAAPGTLPDLKSMSGADKMSLMDTLRDRMTDIRKDVADGSDSDDDESDWSD
jgi:hypothetical protein